MALWFRLGHCICSARCAASSVKMFAPVDSAPFYVCNEIKLAVVGKLEYTSGHDAQ